MTNTERAAEIIEDETSCDVPQWCRDAAEALAAAGLLVTDEAQAVLHAAVEWRQSGPWGGWTGDAVEIAVDAYLASRGER